MAQGVIFERGIRHNFKMLAKHYSLVRRRRSLRIVFQRCCEPDKFASIINLKWIFTEDHRPKDFLEFEIYALLPDS